MSDRVVSSLSRRSVLLGVPALTLAAEAVGCAKATKSEAPAERQTKEEAQPLALEAFELGASPWPTFDPFLFCVHHNDDFPAGNTTLGPSASLSGRNIGSDFAGKDGWRMYHGRAVPGFPQHPHRGFETVTVTRRGFIDHSDSLGATARYGEGDVQWMTAGSGIVHAEMFPLLSETSRNPGELFQIWLNLPKANKFAKPYFSMFWHEKIPEVHHVDAQGRKTSITVTAGECAGQVPPAPPPDSWASQPQSAIAIWTIRMAKGAQWTLPPAPPGVSRTLYFFEGQELRLSAEHAPEYVASVGSGLRLLEQGALQLENGSKPAEVLMLQGRPIGEPVARRGPFVMNNSGEIQQAYADYRRTRFGGWPWQVSDPVHTRLSGRFAIHADGRKESAG